MFTFGSVVNFLESRKEESPTEEGLVFLELSRNNTWDLLSENGNAVGKVFCSYCRRLCPPPPVCVCGGIFFKGSHWLPPVVDASDKPLQDQKEVGVVAENLRFTQKCVYISTCWFAIYTLSRNHFLNVYI